MNWNNEMKNGTGYMNYHALQPKQIPKWAKAENLEMIRPLCELWGLSNTVDRTRKQISFKKIAHESNKRIKPLWRRRNRILCLNSGRC